MDLETNRNVTLAKLVALPLVPLVLLFRATKFLVKGILEAAYVFLYFQMMSEEEIQHIDYETKLKDEFKIECERGWPVAWNQAFLMGASMLFIFPVCLVSGPLAIYGWAVFFANTYRLIIWLWRLYNVAYYSVFGETK